MRTLSKQIRLALRGKTATLLMGLGLLAISALLIQQVLAQNVQPGLKPPYHRNLHPVTASDVIVPPLPLDAPILVSEDFGSSYAPTTTLSAVGWHQVTGTQATVGYTWGRVITGPHPDSVWIAGTPLNAEPVLSPGTDTYTDGMQALLIYGPIDLSDYGAAFISATTFLDAQPGDFFGAAVSTDGSNFDALSAESSLDPSLSVTHTEIYALPIDVRRLSSVWIAFYFQSNDDHNVGLGAFIDDVVVRDEPLSKVYMPFVVKQPTPTPTSTPTATPIPYVYNYTFGSGGSNNADFVAWGGKRASSCGTDCTYTQDVIASPGGHPGGAMTLYLDAANSIGGASPNVQAPTNYELSADLYVYNGQKDARIGLIFGASQSTFDANKDNPAFNADRNYYKLELQFSTTDRNVLAYYQMHECTNGACGAITAQGNLPIGIVSGTWNTVKVRQVGNQFTFYFNGTPMATGTGSSDWSTNRRKFGVYVEARGSNGNNGPLDMVFDHVTVTQLP